MSSKGLLQASFLLQKPSSWLAGLEFSLSCGEREVMWDTYLLWAARALINILAMLPVLYSAPSILKMLWHDIMLVG